jgi:TonB family protein
MEMKIYMRTILLLILLSLDAAMAFGTDPKELEKPLGDQFKGKILILRGFPKDNKLTFDSAGQLKRAAHIGNWTNSQIRVDEVQAKGDSLLITGKHANAGDERSPFAFSLKNVEITIQGPFTRSTADTVNAIREQLFLGDKELASVVPDPWMALFAGIVSPDRDKKGSYTLILPASKDISASSDPAIVGKLANGDYLYKVKGDLKSPKATYMPDPEYTDAARKAHSQGTVVLVAIVGKTGDVDQIYFANPAGIGFDDKALAALQRWKFQPATKDGVPVACVVSVEMSFHLY